jgi:pimeloyl-ACP methyl ester carboxylesterase
MGSGSPTVVFDSGWEDWAPAWSKVQPEVAKWTRACSYDRAGTGFSDPGPMPRTSVHIAEELRTARRHGGIGGPYILVGHAFGGDNVRTFADLFMGEVAGLESVIRPNHQERFLSSAGSCCRKMVEFVARGDPSAYANASG